MTIKPKLLCLHGALGSAAQLQWALHPLAAYFDLHFFDFPGHGERTDEQLSMESCIAATRDFIHKNKLAGVTIFGYSMGGYVALLLAKKFPELVGQIVTLGTKLDWNPEVAAKEARMLNPEKMLEKIPHYVDYLKKWHGRDWSTTVKQTADLMRNLGQTRPLHTDVYQTILHPVLLCLADDDNMVSVNETHHAANMLPFGAFHSMANSKHPIEKVDMEELGKALFFLAGG